MNPSRLLRRRQQQPPAQWLGYLLVVLLLTTTAFSNGTFGTDAFTIPSDTISTTTSGSIRRFVKAKSQSQRYLWPRTIKEKETPQAQQQQEELHEQHQKQQQQQPGIQALQRLLTRQEAEVEDTKRLLQLIQLQQQHADQSNGKNAAAAAAAFDASTTRTTTSTTEPPPVSLMSMATSVMRGFDYGFVSRSEGPKLVLSNLPALQQQQQQTTTTSSVEAAGYGPPENIWSLGTKQFMRNLQAMFNEYRDEQEIGTIHSGLHHNCLLRLLLLLFSIYSTQCSSIGDSSLEPSFSYSLSLYINYISMIHRTIPPTTGVSNKVTILDLECICHLGT
jgi:hypothetical protein